MPALNIKKHIPYGRQTIGPSDVQAVLKALRSDFLTQGPAVGAFEQALCAYTGARYAVAVANGTAALHLACLAAGITKGDEVITSPLTFAASANCVLYCGGTPVFADIDPSTGNVDPRAAALKITKRSRMIIPVHFAGQPCDMQAIHALARKNRLMVLEDAAHALGAEYQGQRIGSCAYSDMAIFSFHPVKHITTAEGGAILTNRKDLYERLMDLRTHGITKDPLKLKNKKQGGWYYEMQSLGFNYRISDLQCALGISQITRLEDFLKVRRRIAALYDKAFGDDPRVITPIHVPGTQHAYHLYPLRLNPRLARYRAQIFEQLRQRGIGVQVHYIPVYWHPYYQKLGYRKKSCLAAESYYLSEISLPMYPGLMLKDVRQVIQTVLSILETYPK